MIEQPDLLCNQRPVAPSDQASIAELLLWRPMSRDEEQATPGCRLDETPVARLLQCSATRRTKTRTSPATCAAGSLPRIAGEKRDELCGHGAGGVIQTPGVARDNQRVYVGAELRICKFVGEIPFEHRPRQLSAFPRHVLLKRGDDSLGIASFIFEPNGQVKQIPAFLALIECAEFRRQQFVEVECRDIGGAGIPPRRDREGWPYVSEYRDVLARVDLDL